MIFWYPNLHLSDDGLGGHGGRPHMACNLRTHVVLQHGKFQPPSCNGVAVHKEHTEVQTKWGLSNICLDSSMYPMSYVIVYSSSLPMGRKVPRATVCAACPVA